MRSEQRMMPHEVTRIFNALVDDGSENEVIAMRNHFLGVYENCHLYLNEWSSNLTEFAVFNWMQMLCVPSWQLIVDTNVYLMGKGVNINEGILFNEFCELTKFIETHNGTDEYAKKMMHERWTLFF